MVRDRACDGGTAPAFALGPQELPGGLWFPVKGPKSFLSFQSFKPRNSLTQHGGRQRSRISGRRMIEAFDISTCASVRHMRSR
jgi:hypothetical protein